MVRMIFSLSVIVIIYFLEGAIPYYKNRMSRIDHALPHIFLSVINGVLTGVIFAGITAAVVLIAENSQAGFLNMGTMPVFLRGTLAFIFLDLWMYVWHRINHRIRFLWRFHRVHHNDPEMDVTTVLRFHPLEITFFSILNLGVILLVGFKVYNLIIYRLSMQPVISFHRSNVYLPKRWDDLLCLGLVTPNMHRVHHSQVWDETNFNYSSFFSFWDRLFRTFKKREDVEKIDFGIRLFMDKKWQGIKGLLLIPFKKNE